MNNKKLIRFVQSFLILPIVTMSIPFGDTPKYDSTIVLAPQIALSPKLNIEANGLLAFNQVIDQKAKDLEAKANAIDSYFRQHNMPLEGMGLKMVQEAEKNGLDWRLIAAIATQESTGGKFACKTVKFNPFGWHSCKIGFDSWDDAIETVARNLGGNEPKTAYHYEGKDTKEILEKYNPPKIAPKYVKKIMYIMDKIGKNVEAETIAEV